MITILITAIIGLVLGLIIAIIIHEWFFIYLGYSIGGIIVGALIGFFITVLTPKDCEVVVIKTTELENIKDNSMTSGNFFLGCGSINGSMVYTFYEKIDTNEFQLRTISCYVTTIAYTDSVPRIEEYSLRELNNEHNRKYTIGLSLFPYVSAFSQYKIYVPKGSIKQNYVLDAE
jgi:hypothetical protein